MKPFKKLKITDWEVLSIRVILLFVTAMLISYSPQFLRGFFEDMPYEIDKWGYQKTRGIIDDHWDWGFRHYLYFYMCLILFGIQAVRIIKWVNKTSDKRNAFPVETRDDNDD